MGKEERKRNEQSGIGFLKLRNRAESLKHVYAFKYKCLQSSTSNFGNK